MRAFLDEIEATINRGIWSPALAATLIVPDACGAIEFPLRRNGVRYANWYDIYVEPFAFEISSGGELVWKIRNGMLHEAGVQFDAFGFDRVLFTLPNRRGVVMDQNRMRIGPDAPVTLNLDLTAFVARVIKGAERWLAAIATDEDKLARLDRLIQFRPGGLSPFIVGAPLIA